MTKKSLLKLFVTIVSICLLLCSCDLSKKIEYYSQKENYIDVTGTVSFINYNEADTGLYIGLSEISPVLDDTCFKIVGKNLEIVKDNEIDNKLQIGAQITLMTAPKYFGDGYVMPIVAISINGENLLDFEEGYQNLLDWLSE